MRFLWIIGLLISQAETRGDDPAVRPNQTNLISPWVKVAPPAPITRGGALASSYLQSASNSTGPFVTDVGGTAASANTPVAPALNFASLDPSVFAWPTQRLRRSMAPVKDFIEWFGGGTLRPLSQGTDPVYELVSGRGRTRCQVGSTRANLLGVHVALSQVPQIQGGELWMSLSDLQRTVHPLIWGSNVITLKGSRIVVIDPGHGGRDVGASSADGRGYEKNLTLDWALRLKSILEQQGWRVGLTRTNDTDLSLAERVYYAEAVQADLFVSLHFNSAPPKAGRQGLETYALTPPGMMSTVVRDSEDIPSLRFPNNRHDEANLLLAWEIQRAVLTAAGSVDRGVQRARFMGVLRGQDRPAVLVEGGYLSHPDEARKIADPSYRQRLAEGVGNALKHWLTPAP